ncbi:MAG: flagellar hook-associated protein FlgK [Pseudomonadota bacterium]
MASAPLINIGLSGLRAHQAALSTTGQNVTNASTPGYTRQRAAFETQTSLGQGFGAHGVRLDGIDRVYDQATVNQERLDTSAAARLDRMAGQLSQVDSLLAGEAGNLNRGFEQFFSAMHSAANEPTSLAARQLVISEAQGLVSRFQGLDGRLRDQLHEVDRQIDSTLVEVNQLAQSLGEMNARLGGMREADADTNALLDQRDELLRELSEHMDVRVVDGEGLGANVFLGKGHSLVVGTRVNALERGSDGALRMAGPQGETAPAADVRGGALGGLIAAREQTLEPVLDEIGRMALAFSATLNATHARGLDLRGDYGGTLFADVNAEARARDRVSADNPAARESGDVPIGVRVSDPARLEPSDYRLSFAEAGANRFEVVRERDGEVVAGGDLGRRPEEIEFDGLTLELGDGDLRAGAEFRVSAVADAVPAFGVALADPRELALASPVAISRGAGNQGTAGIELDSVNETGRGALAGSDRMTPPLLVRFGSEDTYEILDGSDPTDPQPLTPPVWGMPYAGNGEQPLLPEDDQRLLVSDGRDSGGWSGGAVDTDDLTPARNGFAGETVTVRDGRGGAERVEIQPGMSARAVAAALNERDGVSAAARTRLELSDLRDNGMGEALTVAVNGEAFELAPESSLNDLADAISGSDALRGAGIEAVSDGDTLELTSRHGDDLALHVAGDVTDGVTVTDAAGTSIDLRGRGPSPAGEGRYQGVTAGGEVRLLLDDGVDVTSESTAPGGGLFSAEPVALPAALGFQATVSGSPEAGDTFEIDFNGGGNLDNHNALELAGLQTRPTLGDPPATFAENVSRVIEEVGIRTSQARTDSQAAESLLEQSVARRESISGVNLDEEAADLIRFEQGYNASARVVSVAREMFDALLGAVG